MPQWTHHRARVAALSRDRAPDDPELLAARRDLAAAREAERGEIAARRLAAYIQRTVASAPPFTAAQIDQLSRVFRGPSGGSTT
jgi:hypothetical protein